MNRETRRKKDFLEMEKLIRSFQKTFRSYLCKKGYDPDKISDKKAKEILAFLL